jgi:hypothetical protein
MAGSAGVMLSEIAQQHPKAVLDVFKGTPGFMVEQKKQSYSANAEEALTMDVINVGLIGVGGFKMAGIKSISGTRTAPKYAVKTGGVGSGKAGFVKPSEFSGGYKRVITLEDGTKGVTSDVIIKGAPTKSDSAELTGAMKTYDSLKADVEYGKHNKAVIDRVDAKAKLYGESVKLDKKNAEWDAFNKGILDENARHEAAKPDIEYGKHNKAVIDRVDTRAKLYEDSVKFDKQKAEWDAFNKEILDENARHEAARDDIAFGKKNKMVIDRVDARAKTYKSMLQ